MKQYHVLGLVKYELQSLIKANGHYAVMGVYSLSEEGKHALTEDDPLLLPKGKGENSLKLKPRKESLDSYTEQNCKR